MKIFNAIVHWLGTPFRMIGCVVTFLLNLTTQQMRALFSLAMVGGMITLSFQNVWYTYRAERLVTKGKEYSSFFDLLLEQLRFNSGLIAWFAVIMGLIVFGADYFRAKWGDKEVGMGKQKPDPTPGEPPTIQPILVVEPTLTLNPDEPAKAGESDCLVK